MLYVIVDVARLTMAHYLLKKRIMLQQQQEKLRAEKELFDTKRTKPQNEHSQTLGIGETGETSHADVRSLLTAACDLPEAQINHTADSQPTDSHIYRTALDIKHTGHISREDPTIGNAQDDSETDRAAVRGIATSGEHRGSVDVQRGAEASSCGLRDSEVNRSYSNRPSVVHGGTAVTGAGQQVDTPVIQRASAQRLREDRMKQELEKDKLISRILGVVRASMKESLDNVDTCDTAMLKQCVNVLCNPVNGVVDGSMFNNIPAADQPRAPAGIGETDHGENCPVLNRPMSKPRSETSLIRGPMDIGQLAVSTPSARKTLYHPIPTKPSMPSLEGYKLPNAYHTFGHQEPVVIAPASVDFEEEAHSAKSEFERTPFSFPSSADLRGYMSYHAKPSGEAGSHLRNESVSRHANMDQAPPSRHTNMDQAPLSRHTNMDQDPAKKHSDWHMSRPAQYHPSHDQGDGSNYQTFLHGMDISRAQSLPREHDHTTSHRFPLLAHSGVGSEERAFTQPSSAHQEGAPKLEMSTTTPLPCPQQEHYAVSEHLLNGVDNIRNHVRSENDFTEKGSDRGLPLNSVDRVGADRGLPLNGVDRVGADRGLPLNGVDRVGADRGLPLHGVDHVGADRGLPLNGVDRVGADRGLPLNGVDRVGADRGLSLHGVDRSSSDRGLSLHGVDHVGADRGLPLNGVDRVGADRGLPLHGVDHVGADRGLPLNGVDRVGADRGLPLNGVDRVGADRGLPLNGVDRVGADRGLPLNGVDRSSSDRELFGAQHGAVSSTNIPHNPGSRRRRCESSEPAMDGYPVTSSGRNKGLGRNNEPKFECQVCGDVAAGFHCGAYVCEACKVCYVF